VTYKQSGAVVSSPAAAVNDRLKGPAVNCDWPAVLGENKSDLTAWHPDTGPRRQLQLPTKLIMPRRVGRVISGVCDFACLCVCLSAL